MKDEASRGERPYTYTGEWDKIISFSGVFPGVVVLDFIAIVLYTPVCVTCGSMGAHIIV
jgi:hypothetical protein